MISKCWLLNELNLHAIETATGLATSYENQNTPYNYTTKPLYFSIILRYVRNDVKTNYTKLLTSIKIHPKLTNNKKKFCLPVVKISCFSWKFFKYSFKESNWYFNDESSSFQFLTRRAQIFAILFFVKLLLHFGKKLSDPLTPSIQL